MARECPVCGYEAEDEDEAEDHWRENHLGRGIFDWWDWEEAFSLSRLKSLGPERKIAELRRRVRTRLRGPEVRSPESEYEELSVTVEPSSRVVESAIRGALDKEGWTYEGGHRDWFFGDTVLLFHRGEED